jgi:hypothetical protein
MINLHRTSYILKNLYRTTYEQVEQLPPAHEEHLLFDELPEREAKSPFPPFEDTAKVENFFIRVFCLHSGHSRFSAFVPKG